MDLFERSSFGELNPAIVEGFLTFHKEHPEVYALFQKLALELWAVGIRRYGAGAIFERMRWHEVVEKGNRDYKLNNDWRAPMSRLLILDYPQFADFFETRKSRAA